MKAWGFFRGEGRLPVASELAAARATVGFQHLILNDRERTVQFDRPGVGLDLGGIAKGYAVDRVVSLLKRHRIERALISAGGSTLYGMGAPPGSKGWEAQIQDPVDPRRIALTIRLKDRALSISGSSEKFFEVAGVRYSHLMDPRTGWPVQNILSVAVLAQSGTEGDALDNICSVHGAERSRAYLKHFPGAEVLFFVPAPGKGWKLVRAKNQ
jgi:thiamine biosynthesis lipoprotein